MHKRADIQALRGWAILLVVLDHAGIWPFSHGYLGVDIFFVISGFLIGGIIMRDVEAGRFSFRDFYWRRAKRILPAAYAAVALTCLAALWFLSSLQLRDLTWQAIGALTWTANFVLLGQTGYFATAANMKPLLHMWSLSIEEQFYLIVPAVLVFVPARGWTFTVALICALSFALCIYWDAANPEGAFYMLPSRAWELGIGVGAALLTQRRPNWRASTWLLLPALVALIVVPIWSTGLPHPGADAAIVCLATAVVILSSRKSVGAAARWIGLVALGDISYSLYLIHWPVDAFLNNAYFGSPPLAVRIGLVVLSLALAILLFWTIERPVHRARLRPSAAYGAAALAAAFVICGVQYVGASSESRTYATELRPSVGFGENCMFGLAFEAGGCQNVAVPETLVWGDSYAAQYVNALSGVLRGGLLQATFNSCFPTPGEALDRTGSQPDPLGWANLCLKFNRAAIDRAVNDPAIHTVVISSPFRGYSSGMAILQADGTGKLTPAKSSLGAAIASLRSALTAITGAGKHVILFGPAPIFSGGDSSLCVERRARGLLSFGPQASCLIARAAAERRDADPIQILAAVKGMPNVTIVNLYDAMCSATECPTAVDGHPLYRDAGHLSDFGAHWLLNRLKSAHLLSGRSF